MLIFYGHPFSSYTWKALIALYEKDIAFDYRNVDPAFPDHMPELRAHWPVGQFPLIVHDGVPYFETSIIIEYLDRLVPEPRMIPADPDAALRVRFFDRIFDHHVMAQGQHVVNDAIRGPDGHVPSIVDGAKAKLETIYAWLDKELAGGGWATPYGFTLADCAAAPSLFYADWVHRIDAKYENLRGYRARLLAHPSVSRCVEEARPYRAYFPLGAPDRD
ncbi:MULTISPECIES: glutathione S-transferase family protein [unclassified Sphingopyxis]|uniref:glutathione S-transferase family protein n=1 Tax=unclassified Sphingopyxis TaxID=2614943 RepID=UPI000736CAFB|nr:MULTISPECIES: glutathione S-transferase family protein [unclassified Sphingopyxis]KTE39020.1 glutathione S-transferase [Sphingopyxis sp. HIX]KTE83514.1 glutathione S-transferase [Sphingopyxis sp. HXXIV]